LIIFEKYAYPFSNVNLQILLPLDDVGWDPWGERQEGTLLRGVLSEEVTLFMFLQKSFFYRGLLQEFISN